MNTETDARLGTSAEHALAAELADDKKAFMGAMYAYLDDFTELSDRLNAEAKTMGIGRREDAEDAVSSIRRLHFRVAQRLAEVRRAIRCAGTLPRPRHAIVLHVSHNPDRPVLIVPGAP